MSSAGDLTSEDGDRRSEVCWGGEEREGTKAQRHEGRGRVTTQGGASQGLEDNALRAPFNPAELGLSDPRPVLVSRQTPA